MNTIKIHEGGFINEYPITNVETHPSHDSLLESYRTIYNKDLKELQEPELLAPQQIDILNEVINDLKEDICKLEETLFVNKKDKKKISENIGKLEKLIDKTEKLINEKLDYEKIKETLCKLEEDLFIAKGLLENDVTYKKYSKIVEENNNNVSFKMLVSDSSNPTEPKGLGWFILQINKMREKVIGKIIKAMDIVKVNLDSVNKIDVNKELPDAQIREKYNNYKSNFFTEKFEENSEKYNSLMENILPFNIFDSQLFKPLQEYDGARIKNFIVINKDNYELFRYNNTPIENYYLINEDYSFTKIEPKIFIEKKDYYPVFDKKNAIHSLFMEGLLCYSNKDNVLAIIKFLYKFESTFIDWIKNYYIYNMDTNILLIPKSPTIFKTIILANGINYYINFYRDSYNTIKYNFSNISNCEQVLIDKFNKIYTNPDNNEDIIKILKLLIKEVTIDEDTIIRLIYSSNIINKEKLCNFLYAISINFKLIKNNIISAYNFLNITYYYEILKTKFTDRTNFIAELSNINYYIKMSSVNVWNLFLINMLSEVIIFDKLKNDTFLSDQLFSLIFYFYIDHIFNSSLKTLVNYKHQYKLLGISNSITLTESLSDNWDFEKYQFLYQGLFNSLKGFEVRDYTEANLYKYFIDPRGDARAQATIGTGRPMCGEVTIMNFLNFLLYNKDTQKIDYNFLPEETNENRELVDFYKINTNIKKYKNKDVAMKFFDFLKNIPFNVKKGIDDSNISNRINRDYGDNNLGSIYRYYILTEDNTKFKAGEELRVTYFNLCRVLSYILKLKDDLSNENIETNLNESTLKNIIAKFRNPNKDLIKDYKLIYDTSETEIYKFNQISIRFNNVTLSLGCHSTFSIKSVSSNIKKDIRKLIPTILNNYYLDLLKILTIPQSIFLAIFKGTNIFSEIRFDKMLESDIIKFIDIYANTDIVIPNPIIKTLIDKNYRIALNKIFETFIITSYSKKIYLLFLLDNNISINDDKINYFFIKNYHVPLDNLLLDKLILHEYYNIINFLIENNILKISQWPLLLSNIKTKKIFDYIIEKFKYTPKIIYKNLMLDIYSNKDIFYIPYIHKSIIKQADGKGYTPLFHAILSNNYFNIEQLIKNGAKLDTITKDDNKNIFNFIYTKKILDLVKPLYRNYDRDEIIHLRLLESNCYNKIEKFISNDDSMVVSQLKIDIDDVYELLKYIISKKGNDLTFINKSLTCFYSDTYFTSTIKLYANNTNDIKENINKIYNYLTILDMYNESFINDEKTYYTLCVILINYLSITNINKLKSEMINNLFDLSYFKNIDILYKKFYDKYILFFETNLNIIKLKVPILNSFINSPGSLYYSLSTFKKICHQHKLLTDEMLFKNFDGSTILVDYIKSIYTRELSETYYSTYSSYNFIDMINFLYVMEIYKFDYNFEKLEMSSELIEENKTLSQIEKNYLNLFGFLLNFNDKKINSSNVTVITKFFKKLCMILQYNKILIKIICKIIENKTINSIVYKDIYGTEINIKNILVFHMKTINPVILFTTDENIDKIKKYIEENSHKNKYLKYKNKYMNLIKKLKK